MYAFCSMPRYPGHFWLCYQLGKDKPKGAWPLKVVPGAFELRGATYNDMIVLKNGFKMLVQSGAAGRPPAAQLPRR